MPLNENQLRKREMRERQEQRNGGAPPAAPGPNYSYGNPGQYGAPGYSYQPGDEFNNPGPEPPRDSPEWPAWKAHAKAWRNFIGGRQRYVDDIISAGYSPEDIGILPVKEQGLAGWNRLNRSAGESSGWEYDWANGRKRDIGTSDQEKGWFAIGADEQTRHRAGGTRIDELRRNQENWIANNPGREDWRIDPTTGLYTDGQGGYMDRLGGFTDSTGRRIGGVYGMDAGQRFATNRHSAPGTGTGNVTGWGTTVGVPNVNGKVFGGPAPAPTPANPPAPAPNSSYYTARPYLRENTGAAWGGWGNPYGVSQDRARTKQYSARVGQKIIPR